MTYDNVSCRFNARSIESLDCLVETSMLVFLLFLSQFPQHYVFNVQFIIHTSVLIVAVVIDVVVLFVVVVHVVPNADLELLTSAVGEFLLRLT